jgi:hypothetical protein
MSKEAIKLQADIVNATSKLHSLGFRIKCTYLPGAGWASEIVNNNTGENHELDEHSKPKFQDDYQAKLDAEQEKNNDYALDNMTSDEMEQIELESESRNVTPETVIKDWSGDDNENNS